MGRHINLRKLSIKQRDELLNFINSPESSAREKNRSLAILDCVDSHLSQKQIADKYGCSPRTLSLWRKAFLQSGIRGIKSEPIPGRPRKVDTTFELNQSEKDKLLALVRRKKTAQHLSTRAAVLLLSDEGLTRQQIAQKTSMSESNIGKLQKRFTQERLEMLTDSPRSGRPRSIPDKKIEEVIALTLESKPEDATHWSTRSLARKVGLASSTISRIWHAFELKPHLQETFQLSTDPFFIEKTRDVVGLYLSPPENAIVLCIDEKSQIQALERTQPVLPMRPGQAERQTHEYYRHGTLSLFAAFEVLTGKVIGQCYEKHTHKEFIKFLKKVERETPKKKELHVVLDNYATHKTPAVKAWLLKHPRWHLHFIPTHSSWLNQVERFFGILTQKQIRRNVFTSLNHLRKTINDFLVKYNENPKPFEWKADADVILEKVKCLCEKVNAVHVKE